MEKIFVIAGTMGEFENYRARKIEEMHARQMLDFSYSDIVYVSSAIQLRGVSNPHGVFLGSWRERKDIAEIVMELMMRCPANDSLKNIYESIKPQIKAKQAINRAVLVSLNGVVQDPADYIVTNDAVVFSKPVPAALSVQIYDGKNIVTYKGNGSDDSFRLPVKQFSASYTNDDAVQDAAKALAKQIDAEVLRQVMNMNTGMTLEQFENTYANLWSKP